MSISLTLNGRPCSRGDDPDTPLLWGLRESSGLTGTQFGCGLGDCDIGVRMREAFAAAAQALAETPQ